MAMGDIDGMHLTLVHDGYELVAETVTSHVQVYKKDDTYHVLSQGVIKHPRIDADGAIRALCHYLSNNHGV